MRNMYFENVLIQWAKDFYWDGLKYGHKEADMEPEAWFKMFVEYVNEHKLKNKV